MDDFPTENPRRTLWSLAALNLQQRARFGHAGGRASVLAGSYSRQGHDMTPAVGGPGRREFLGHGAIEFFSVQSPIFTDREAEQQIE